jgi:hypothetical protein
MATLILQPVNAQDTKIFESEKYGAEFSYPSDWTVIEKEETPPIYFFISSTGTFPQVTLEAARFLDPEGNPPTLENAIKEVQGDERNTILNSGRYSVNGREFYIESKVSKQESEGTKWLSAMTVTDDGTAYWFKLFGDSEQTYSAGLPVLQQMISSAQLTGLGQEQQGGQGGQFNPFDSSEEEGQNPFEPDTDGQDGEFGNQNPDGSGGDNDDSDAFPQQPSPNGPLCGPGSCVVS